MLKAIFHVTGIESSQYVTVVGVFLEDLENDLPLQLSKAEVLLVAAELQDFALKDVFAVLLDISQ
jgi:hypothetical protein